MKTSIMNNKLHATLIAVTFTLMIASTPWAFADPNPGGGTIPPNVVTGTTQIQLELTGIGAGGQTNGKVQVFEENALINTPGNPVNNDCVLATPQVVTDKNWVLVDDGTTNAALYQLPQGGTIQIKFGGAGSFTPTTTGVGTSINGGNLVEWYDVTNAVANTDALSQNVGDVHRWFTCGYDGAAPIAPATKGQFDASNVFNIESPVGGSILPIDTTALMIGGVASIGLWMIPVLGAVGIAAITIKKKLA